MRFDKRWLMASGIILSLAFFLVSLALPAFHLADGDRIYGFIALGYGWLAILFVSTWGLGVIGWYANVCLVHAVVGLSRAKDRRFAISSLVTAIIGIEIALFSALLRKVMVNEGGTMVDVTSMGSGFYIWLGSFAVCIAADVAILVFDVPVSHNPDSDKQ